MDQLHLVPDQQPCHRASSVPGRAMVASCCILHGGRGKAAVPWEGPLPFLAGVRRARRPGAGVLQSTIYKDGRRLKRRVKNTFLPSSSLQYVMASEVHNDIYLKQLQNCNGTDIIR